MYEYGERPQATGEYFLSGSVYRRIEDGHLVRCGCGKPREWVIHQGTPGEAILCGCKTPVRGRRRQKAGDRDDVDFARRLKDGVGFGSDD